MSLILGIPHAGRVWHIYSDDEKQRSLCMRAPQPRGQLTFDIAKVSCPVCRNAYRILVEHGNPQSPNGHSEKSFGKSSLKTPGKRKRQAIRPSLPSGTLPLRKVKPSASRSKQTSTTKAGPTSRTPRTRGRKHSHTS